MKELKLGSLFDGSGTCPLAGWILGIKPVWASEIEPYPISVSRSNFPDMKHLGSITDINGAEIEPVDIITGGSPCQDLSVAGKRAGLDGGHRSHLFYEMCRVIQEMRDATNGEKPRFVLWENVPGALSSSGGLDFYAVLQNLAQISEPFVYVPEPEKRNGKLDWANAGEISGDGYSIAWRILDASHWGVPQRRRRIFLVVDLGGGRAGQVLFEREGLQWDPETCFGTRQRATGDTEDSTGGSG